MRGFQVTFVTIWVSVIQLHVLWDITYKKLPDDKKHQSDHSVIANNTFEMKIYLPRCIQKTSAASWPWCRCSVYPAPAWYLGTLYHRAAAASQEPSLYLQRHSNSVFKSGFRTELYKWEPGQGPLSPVFPIIFSHGWSVRMLSSSGEMSGVRDHSLTVLSLLQLAMVKGRLWWQVKPTCTALLRLNMIKGSLWSA